VGFYWDRHMRVAFDYQTFAIQPYGGISRYFVELVRRLSLMDDVDARIVAPVHINNYLNNFNQNYVSGRYVSRFPMIEFLRSLYNSVASVPAINKFSPDIVHETYYSRKGIRSIVGNKTVITVHDMIHERFPTYVGARDKTAYVKRKAIDRSDHIICVSHNTRNDLLEITGIDPSKVSVVYHGFDLNVKSTNYYHNLVNEPYILYVGLRDGYKNFQSLLKAFSRNSSLNKVFKLVCFGGGSFTHAERQRNKESGLKEGQVIWVEGDDKVLAQLYSHASALVFPSLYEGFGIPPLEAMSYKCPVVCSNGGSIPEVVGDAGEFFNPTDVDALAEAMIRVLLVPERADFLRAMGTERIKSFSWDTCANRTRDIYESILE